MFNVLMFNGFRPGAFKVHSILKIMIFKINLKFEIRNLKLYYCH